METANYTSENIARSLGLGGFANDLELAASDRSIRLLLQPAFHVELCVSLLDKDDAVDVSVVVARQQIWHQIWPSPKPTEVDRSTGTISSSVFQKLGQSLIEASDDVPHGVVVLDGMRVHTILRAEHTIQIEINDNPGRRTAYSIFVADVLSEVWSSVADPAARNALRSAGTYVGLELPEQPCPQAKPTVRTMILGPTGVASQILDALKSHHKI